MPINKTAGLWYNDGMNITVKIWVVLMLVLALGLGTGCDLATSPGDDDGDNEIAEYSYNVDEITPELFGKMSPTMTMNEWYKATRPPWEASKSYDNSLYKDEKRKSPFAGSDIVDEKTVIFCNYSFNGQGKKTGEITGTITLGDIPFPAATKVYIRSSSYNGYPENWWSLNRKIDMSNVTGTGATLDWSLPVYETLKPNSQATFSLLVLPGDSLNTYTVSVPTQKIISGANATVGNLGTVSVKGVTLSGTITVTLNGQPAPYIEIYANFPVQGPLGITCLSSPEPDAPWSVTFGPDTNKNKLIEFRVYFYSGKNGDYLFDELVSVDPPVLIENNESKLGIVLDVGDVSYSP